MLQIRRSVTRITYIETCEALRGCPNPPGSSDSATLCERQSRLQGSMPFISLNRTLSGRPMVWTGAWQQGIALPEGASPKPRFNHLDRLSHPYPHFDIKMPLFARPKAGPWAEARARRGLDRRRPLGRWSASCRCAVTGQHLDRRPSQQVPHKGSKANRAGCYFTNGVTTANTPHVDLD